MDPLGAGVALGLGLLGAGGQAATNRANAREAQRNRDFQERMSSTAVQRSVEDYRKAGLNPALAYERSASSPGGAQAVMGDVAGKGLSSALSAKQTIEQLRIQRAEAAARVAVASTEAAKNENTSALLGEQARSEAQRRSFEFLYHPSRLRQEVSRALLSEYSLPKSRVMSDVFGDISRVRRGLLEDVPRTAAAWMGAAGATARQAKSLLDFERERDARNRRSQRRRDIVLPPMDRR